MCDVRCYEVRNSITFVEFLFWVSLHLPSQQKMCKNGKCRGIESLQTDDFKSNRLEPRKCRKYGWEPEEYYVNTKFMMQVHQLSTDLFCENRGERFSFLNDLI